MDKKERLIEVLEELSTADLVAVHNRYCDDCRHVEQQIRSRKNTDDSNAYHNCFDS